MALICDDIVHLKMIVVFICLSFFLVFLLVNVASPVQILLGLMK